MLQHFCWARSLIVTEHHFGVAEVIDGTVACSIYPHPNHNSRCWCCGTLQDPSFSTWVVLKRFELLATAHIKSRAQSCTWFVVMFKSVFSRATFQSWKASVTASLQASVRFKSFGFDFEGLGRWVSFSHFRR